MVTFCGRKGPCKQDSKWSVLVCICATISQALLMGIAQDFGVFLPVIMNEFYSSREHTAWIGSIGIALTFFLSPLTGRLGDRYGSRPISIVGGLFCSLGLILTSFVRKLDLFFVTYSVLFGFGVSCCRTSNFLIVTKYFWKRRSLATGIVTAGAGLGVFTLAPLCHLLIDKHGLQGAYRVLGLVTLANCILPLPYDPNIKEDEDPGKKKETFYNQGDYNPEECTAEASSKWRKLIDFSVWKVPLFTVTAACSTAVGIVTYTGQFHLVRHCEDLNISADKSSKLLMIFGVVSCVTRVTAGRLCDIRGVKAIHVFQIGVLVIGLAVLMLGVASTFVHFVFISVFYGIGDGISVTVSNLLLLTTVEPQKRASAFGLANTLISISIATGAPLAGFIADQAGSYVIAFYTAGSMGILFAVLPFILLCAKQETNREEVDSLTVNT
ncbi:monocarboxylate transporter 10-like [Porites lutea]|uniref:monocarboxylate transporter 10-like n=1 Tax=Porites lutea TaxID=51062 RepID=UPI003CC661F4